MRKLLFLALFLIVGCSGIDQAEDPAQITGSGRLDVTERLQLACPQHTDTEIDFFIIAAESGRQQGFTKNVTINDVLWVCGENANPRNCSVCLLAIIDQVYGA